MARDARMRGILILLLVALPAAAQQGPGPVPTPAIPPAAGGTEETSEDVLGRAEELSKSIEARREEALADTALGYDPAGRRDPFRPLVGIAVEEEERGKLPGIAGLHWEEMKLIGVVQTEEGPLAIFFGGQDQMGYFVREGMNFYNGSVHRIDPVASIVTIRQQVEDRSQLKPFRDIDIPLHPLEGTP